MATMKAEGSSEMTKLAAKNYDSKPGMGFGINNINGTGCGSRSTLRSRTATEQATRSARLALGRRRAFIKENQISYFKSMT